MEFLSLKGGCTGSSESTLVKMPHYWKSHVAAHIISGSCLIVNVVRVRTFYTLNGGGGEHAETKIIPDQSALETRNALAHLIEH